MESHHKTYYAIGLDNFPLNNGICYNKNMTLTVSEENEFEGESLNNNDHKDQRRIIIGISISSVVILTALVAIVYYLLLDSSRTMLIRDVMFIILAIELLLVGFAVVLLIIQITRLVNLMQNEIKPLLESANETIFTLRGTAAFISDSFVQPVIKLNSYITGAKKLLDFLYFWK